jgi:hypothetical protein
MIRKYVTCAQVLAFCTIVALGCSETTGTLDPVEACEDDALACLDLVSSGGENIQYLRGEFCGCLGQYCLVEIRRARKDAVVDEEVEQLMDAARCLRHKE